ncbi:MAG: DsbA family oxidoreductase [Kiritimatiellae bacterium]|nr:DsbA family oxidoreductase [Kiritimatiellia bacterium]
MMIQIDYWSDYACPYCYIGEARLKKAAEETLPKGGWTLRMHSFELDPSAPRKTETDTATRFAHKYGLSLAGAKARIEDISSLGRAEGLDFRYATTRYTSTFDAHRLTHYAQSLGDDAKTHKLESLLYAAYFTKNLELADHAVLLDAAVEAGLDRSEAAKVLSSEKFANEVRSDEAQAARMGVHGVPYFVINGKLAIPGAMSKEDFAAALRQAMPEKKPEDAPKSKAHVCGPDGCRLE